MNVLTDAIRAEIKEMVYDYLSDECEVQKDEIREDMSVLTDLDGDSLMFVEMVEALKKKYGLSINIQNVGKYLLRNTAETVQEVINTLYVVYEKENDIIGEE